MHTPIISFALHSFDALYTLLILEQMVSASRDTHHFTAVDFPSALQYESQFLSLQYTQALEHIWESQSFIEKHIFAWRL